MQWALCRALLASDMVRLGCCVRKRRLGQTKFLGAAWSEPRGSVRLVHVVQVADVRFELAGVAVDVLEA